MLAEIDGKRTSLTPEPSPSVVPIDAFEVDCTTISIIPTVECEALIKLYESTSGDDWQYNGPASGQQWLTTDNPCEWYGVVCHNGHVYSLDLGGGDSGPLGLSGKIPVEIGDLTELTGLSIYNNDVTSIPDVLSQLQQITWLSLSSNQLTSLPTGLGDLTELNFLDVGLNPLASWPISLTNITGLSKLNMYGICEPDDSDLQAWLDNIPEANYRSGILCSEVAIAGQLWVERDGIDGFGVDDDPVDDGIVQVTSMIGDRLYTILASTDNNGLYSVNMLPFSTYTVTVDNSRLYSPGSGTVIVPPSPIIIFSDPDESIDGESNVILATNNVNALTQNFIYTRTSESLIVGQVVGQVEHVDGDPVPGAIVTLIDNSGNEIKVSSTNAMGEYLFMNVPLTTGYVVSVEPATITVADGDDLDENDKDPNTIMPSSPFTASVPFDGHSNTVVESIMIGEIVPSPTPLPTATFTPTPIPTAIFIPTPTPTFTSTPTQDQFEDDDSCEEAMMIGTGGIGQNHTFHDAGDVDWIQFETVAGEIYQVIVEVDGESRANISAGTYSSCDVFEYVNNPFNDYVVLNVVARHDGHYYVQLSNQDESVFGDDVGYRVSVIQMREVQTGAVIIVAGRDKLDDDLQYNIHNVTDRVYRLFHEEEGYPHSHIHYMATNAYENSDPNIQVDANATLENLRNMIINDVYNQVNDEQPLTIYMMSHGLERGGFYLDEVNGQRLYPAKLDEWLDDLQELRPGLEINLIIDACYAGNFVADPNETVAGENRVVIGSSGANQFAWSSFGSANFSDFFLLGLYQRRSLKHAFEVAQAAGSTGGVTQNAWIEDNGSNPPNEADDGDVAATRFLLSYNPSQGDPTVPEMPDSPILSEPIIDPDSIAVTITEHTDPIWGNVTVADFEVRVTADPSLSVAAVQAVLYPPSLTPDEVLPTVIEMEHRGDGVYGGSTVLLEEGGYEVRFYAQGAVPDGVNASLEARPVSETFVYGSIPLSVSQTTVYTSHNGAIGTRFLLIIPFAMMTLWVVYKRDLLR